VRGGLEFDFPDVFVGGGRPYPESRRRLRGPGMRVEAGPGGSSAVWSREPRMSGLRGAATAPHTRRAFPNRVQFLEFLNSWGILCAGNNLSAHDFDRAASERGSRVAARTGESLTRSRSSSMRHGTVRRGPCTRDAACLRGHRRIGWLSLTVTVLESLSARSSMQSSRSGSCRAERRATRRTIWPWILGGRCAWLPSPDAERRQGLELRVRIWRKGHAGVISGLAGPAFKGCSMLRALRTRW
jgi:hypothetical protein